MAFVFPRSSRVSRGGSGGSAAAGSGGWDEAVAKNLEAGFYVHSFCPVGPEGPAFASGSREESQREFHRRPQWRELGLGAWMNICREINVEMAGNLHTQESSARGHGCETCALSRQLARVAQVSIVRRQRVRES